MEYTTHYNLQKPEAGYLDWNVPLNSNFDSIDTALNDIATSGGSSGGGNIDYIIDLNGTVGVDCDYTNFPALLDDGVYLVRAGEYLLENNVEFKNTTLLSDGKVIINNDGSYGFSITAGLQAKLLTGASGVTLTFSSAFPVPSSYDNLYIWNPQNHNIYKVVNVSGNNVTIEENIQNYTTYTENSVGWYMDYFYQINIIGDFTLKGMYFSVNFYNLRNSNLNFYYNNNGEADGICLNRLWYKTKVNIKIENSAFYDSFLYLICKYSNINVVMTNSLLYSAEGIFAGQNNRINLEFYRCATSVGSGVNLLTLNETNSDINVKAKYTISDGTLITENGFYNNCYYRIEDCKAKNYFVQLQKYNGDTKIYIKNSHNTVGGSGGLINLLEGYGINLLINTNYANTIANSISFTDLHDSNIVVDLLTVYVNSGHNFYIDNCYNNKYQFNLNTLNSNVGSTLVQSGLNISNYYDINIYNSASDVISFAMNETNSNININNYDSVSYSDPFIYLSGSNNKLNILNFNNFNYNSIVCHINSSNNIIDMISKESNYDTGLYITGSYNSYKVNSISAQTNDVSISGSHNIGIGCVIQNYLDTGISNLFDVLICNKDI